MLVVVTLPEGREPLVIGPTRAAQWVASEINERADRENLDVAASVVEAIPARFDREWERAVFG